jgi:hypothetical protein
VHIAVQHIVRIALLSGASVVGTAEAFAQPPKVIIISLDGASPSHVEEYLKNGVLDSNSGLGRLRARRISADRNVTATPSVTAVMSSLSRITAWRRFTERST